MTTQHHETMKTLVSGLNIARYQSLLKTELDETKRQTLQSLLAEEELWLKRNISEKRPTIEPKHN